VRKTSHARAVARLRGGANGLRGLFVEYGP
jgi:hypothetical protein